MKKHPYLFFTFLMVLFGAVEVGATPFLTYLAEEGLALTVPLGYAAKALAYLPPFLMVGAVCYEMCNKPFFSALPFFWIYVVTELFGQIPFAAFSYSAVDSSPLWFLIIVYLAKSLLQSLLFFLFLLLGYLLFAKPQGTHAKSFFSLRAADTRALALTVGIIALQDLIVFIISFVEYLRDKFMQYYDFDGADFADILISVAFIAFCALIAFSAGRFAMRRFCIQESNE